jgi:TonB family protein
MSKSKQAFVSTCCALALAANTSAVFAQDRSQARPVKAPATTAPSSVERPTVVVVEPNGSAVTYTRVPELGQPASPAAYIFNNQGHTIFPMPSGPTAPATAAHIFNGQGYTVAGQGGSTPGFIATEMGAGNKVVKGAPYSAEVINEFTQVLADGNRITRRNSSNVYRDSQGRTRSEQRVTPIGLNEWANNISASSSAIFITDPVEGATYVLDKNERVARRSRFVAPYSSPTLVARAGNPANAGTSQPSVAATTELPRQVKVSGGVLQGSAIHKVQPSYPPVAKEARVSGAVQVQLTISEKGEVLEASAVSGHPLLRDAALTAARQWRFKPIELSGVPVKAQGVLTFNFTLDDGPAPTTSPAIAGSLAPAPPQRIQYNREALGKQMIEGIECEGTKMVQIIPAGQIGNERPIEIVLETWYSPELQVTVLGKQSDPRYGETVFRLAGILRTEPDDYLFKVPSDYTVKDDPVGYRVLEEKIRREQ